MKFILDEVNRGLIARGLGQSWFAPSRQNLRVSRAVRGQVLANIVQPVRLAIDNSIRDPLLAVIRAEFSGVRHGRVELYAKSQPKPAQHPHAQSQRQGLAKVKHSVDDTPSNESNSLKELATMIALDDRDRVFAFVQRLLGGQQVVEEQPPKAEDKWLTPDEAAEHANVSRMTIWRWRNERGLKFTQVGNVVRIRRSELQGFLERHMQG